MFSRSPPPPPHPPTWMCSCSLIFSWSAHLILSRTSSNSLLRTPRYRWSQMITHWWNPLSVYFNPSTTWRRCSVKMCRQHLWSIIIPSIQAIVVIIREKLIHDPFLLSLVWTVWFEWRLFAQTNSCRACFDDMIWSLMLGVTSYRVVNLKFEIAFNF